MIYDRAALGGSVPFYFPPFPPPFLIILVAASGR